MQLYIQIQFVLIALWERLKASVFRLARSLPFVSDKIQHEVDKNVFDMEKTFHKAIKGLPYVETIPAKGLSEVIQHICWLLN